MATVLPFLFPTLAVASLGFAFFQNRRKLWFIRFVWRQVRWSTLAGSVLLFGVTLGLIVGLLHASPYFALGWPTVFFGLPSNLLLTPVLAASASGQWLPRFAGLGFLAFLGVLPPFLAHREEEIFRLGVPKRSTTVTHSVIFGLHHLFIGVPLAAGIALIVPGFVYAEVYRRAYQRLSSLPEEERQAHSALASTVLHTTCNSVFLLAVALVFLFS